MMTHYSSEKALDLDLDIDFIPWINPRPIYVDQTHSCVTYTF